MLVVLEHHGRNVGFVPREVLHVGLVLVGRHPQLVEVRLERKHGLGLFMDRQVRFGAVDPNGVELEILDNQFSKDFRTVVDNLVFPGGHGHDAPRPRRVGRVHRVPKGQHDEHPDEGLARPRSMVDEQPRGDRLVQGATPRHDVDGQLVVVEHAVFPPARGRHLARGGVKGVIGEKVLFELLRVSKRR